MGSVLLDTTVVIDLLRGRRGALARLLALRDAGDAPYVCAINVEETVRGLRPDERARVRTLFAGLREAPLGSTEGWIAGEWRRDFSARGVTLSQADCLVAASAAAIGGRLATGNPRDFPMDGVSVEHWPVGA
jgi:predicted nucleic acid-binding protein